MPADGVDFGWVMEVTFVLTVVIGTPIIAIGSIWFEIDTWTGRIVFATTVAAAVWFATAIGVYTYDRLGLRTR